ncbi:uncharacterized protein P884DRAFT_278517 [Thermothelomyces heterothallicus CBS 202.75]|uniref:uncharacterized protein n=1 Tax=Thermothelomyces heterothallicus CBS 202.75 TaxID=1149848 RepID=UPI003742C6F8
MAGQNKYGFETTGSQLVQELAPHIRGKVILTTGVSPNSLGAEFVRAIAVAGPALLILAGRDLAKVRQTADAVAAARPDVRTRLLALDLASLSAVRAAAAELNAWADVPAIDVLVNSAGIMALHRYETTADGFERQFGTNHLGHFLFTNLIISKLLAAPAPRVVSVSSAGHRLSSIRWGDLDFHGGENYNKWHAYGQSKTANMLLAVSLAEKLGHKGLRAFSVHPGAIGGTNLGPHLDWDGGEFAGFQALDRALGNEEGWHTGFQFKNIDQGIATYVFAAFHPSLEDHNGDYLLDSHIADPWVDPVKPWATSPVEAERLWKLSEKLVGQEFQY